MFLTGCHEFTFPVTRGHFRSEPEVAVRGRYYCIPKYIYGCKLFICSTVKDMTSEDVQMRRFIWNIIMNPFPHLKTAYGHHQLMDSNRSTDGSYLAIEAQIHQIF